MFHKIKSYFGKKKLINKKYENLFDKYTKDEYVCFDCETTGLNPKIDDVISIGAVLVKENKILVSKKFERFVRPQATLGEESIKIHQIRKCDLQDGKDIKEVIYEFLDFIENRPLIGYNLQFDMAMVNKYIKPSIGVKLPNRQIEVAYMYRKKMSRIHKDQEIDLSFDKIINNLSLPILSKHDAINDAIMTAMIFLKLKE